MNHLPALLLCLALPAAAQPLGDATAALEIPRGAEISVGTAKARVEALSPSVFRVRVAFDGKFVPDRSFAVVPGAFPAPPAVKFSRDAEAVTLDAGVVRAKIFLHPFRVAFLDAAGAVISEDAKGRPVAADGEGFRMERAMPEGERYFALGDKTGPLDRRGQSFVMWNTDAFHWQESTDPIYKSVPFYLAGRAGRYHGIFVDDTYRANFDFGRARADDLQIAAEGGALDYYFFYGPEPKKVLEDFTALVGREPLPPLFALGYQQSRWSYYPESQVRELAAEFRKRRIPADVLYLDIDYQKDNRPFTVDPARFPSLPKLASDLKDQGFKLVLITDLHIAKAPGYKPYDEGLAKGLFVKNPDGTTYVGKVWPGDSVFPDFTRAEARKWWGGLYAGFLDAGARGFWNDMNEPALFERADKTMPLGTVHDVEGRKTDHREIHNVFGMQNARATFEGLLRLRPEQRPLVLTRAGYAGTQRYAATWTGDNTSTWNHMRLSTPQLLNLGLSGWAFVGDDIGGFVGEPTAELLTRWMELGAFNPFYRNHSIKGSRRREPWTDGPEHEAIRRRYIEARYRLLPYIYAGMEEASRDGTPLMRPLFLEYPGDAASAGEDEEFMLGDALLVAPKVWESSGSYEVRLPPGDWYDYWTGLKMPAGRTFRSDPPLDVMPVYARGGRIVPLQPLIQYVGEAPRGPLELRVYPGPDCRGELYADDGESFAYKSGGFLRQRLTCAVSMDRLDVVLAPAEGKFKPWFSEMRVTVFGAGKVRGLRVDGRETPGWTADGQTVTLPVLPWTASGRKLTLLY
jgi:alpha-glucosidase